MHVGLWQMGRYLGYSESLEEWLTSSPSGILQEHNFSSTSFGMHWVACWGLYSEEQVKCWQLRKSRRLEEGRHPPSDSWGPWRGFPSACREGHPPFAWRVLNRVPTGRAPLRKGLAGSNQRMQRSSNAYDMEQVSTEPVWVISKDSTISGQARPQQTHGIFSLGPHDFLV